MSKKTNLIKALHISTNPSLPDILKPRQPTSESTGEENSISTERLPNRVSFALTIDECIWATYPIFSDEFERVDSPVKYKDFYVYGAYLDSNHGNIAKSEMESNLHDYHVTNEIAVTEPVKIVKVGKIRLFNDEPKPNPVYYYPYGDPKNGRYFAGPRPTYKIITQQNKDFDLISRGPYIFKESK